MSELIRDTVFGHCVRLVTRAKVLQYAEEKDPSLWKRYLHEEKTAQMAHHGQLGDENIKSEDPNESHGNLADTQPSSEESSNTQVEKMRTTNTIGQKIDQEKGRDVNIVGWFGDDDPENPMNWSLFKKVFATAEICLLTTSVYIGSAIYSAGTESVSMTFDVSEVAATLGLTLFVAGYGVGPMLWYVLLWSFSRPQQVPEALCHVCSKTSFPLFDAKAIPRWRKFFHTARIVGPVQRTTGLYVLTFCYPAILGSNDQCPYRVKLSVRNKLLVGI